MNYKFWNFWANGSIWPNIWILSAFGWYVRGLLTNFFQFLTFDFHLLTVQDFNFKCNGAIFSNASTFSHAREVNAHVALDDNNIRSTYRARENSAHRLIRITIILPPQNIKEIGINPKRARMVKDGEDIHGLQKYTSKRIFSSDIAV